MNGDLNLHVKREGKHERSYLCDLKALLPPAQVPACPVCLLPLSSPSFLQASSDSLAVNCSHAITVGIPDVFKDDMSQKPCCPHIQEPPTMNQSAPELGETHHAEIGINASQWTITLKIDPSPFSMSGQKSKSFPEPEFDGSPLAGGYVGYIV